MIRFVMVGHVDSGKSTLCGQILLRVGHIDQREFEKVRDQSTKDGMGKWAYARLLDTFEEEQERGKTHEYNIVDFTYMNKEYSLIDTPGHASYVRSMIAGLTTGADVVVIIVSMHEKEWNAGFNGMLLEHIKLAKGLGVKNAIIAANKMDLIDWDKKKCFDRIREIKKFCIDIGFDDKNVKAIPISAWNGIGIIDRTGLPGWYTGPCLLDMIRSCSAVENDSGRKRSNELLLEFVSDYDGIITVGFTGIAYLGNIEMDFEIVSSKIKIIRHGETALCWIKLREPVELLGTSIVLRNTYTTIGIGEIKKYKETC